MLGFFNIPLKYTSLHTNSGVFEKLDTGKWCLHEFFWQMTILIYMSLLSSFGFSLITQDLEGMFSIAVMQL